MNNIRKYVSILLTVLMLLSAAVAVPVTASAETSGDWSYSVSDNKATITGYSGEGGDITIPSTLGGYSVTAIGEEAFEYNSTITGVTIPATVTSIGYEAFFESGIESIVIPNSVTSIADYAFAYCQNLTTISIGSGVESLGDYVFDYSKKITSITVDAANAVFSSDDGILYNKKRTSLIQ